MAHAGVHVQGHVQPGGFHLRFHSPHTFQRLPLVVVAEMAHDFGFDFAEIHAVDAIEQDRGRDLVGAEPLEVFGWQVTGSALSLSKGPRGADLTFVGQMRFENGVHAQFDSGFSSPFRAFMEIVGSEATLNIPVPFKPGRHEIMHPHRGEALERIKIPGQDLYSGEVEDTADAVLLGKPPLISLEDSRANVAAILALLESARRSKPVDIPLKLV